jgi:hypothetical protein
MEMLKGTITSNVQHNRLCVSLKILFYFILQANRIARLDGLNLFS